MGEFPLVGRLRLQLLPDDKVGHVAGPQVALVVLHGGCIVIINLLQAKSGKGFVKFRFIIGFALFGYMEQATRLDARDLC